RADGRAGRGRVAHGRPDGGPRGGGRRLSSGAAGGASRPVRAGPGRGRAARAAARGAAGDGFRRAQRGRRPDLCARAACALGPTLLPLQPGTVDDQRVELLEEALRLIPPREKAQRIRVTSELAVALYWSSDSRRSMDVAENAVALARKLG